MPLRSSIQIFSKNPLYILLLAQTLFLVVGIQFLEFNITKMQILVAILAAVATEYFFTKIGGRRFQFPASALAAALGLALFFRSSTIYLFAVAAMIAIASKYLIRKPDGSHIFNPSNIAIVLLIFLVPSYASAEFTQWGGSLLIYCAIALVAFFVVYSARLWLITASFFVVYTSCFFLLIEKMSSTLPAHHYGLLGPSLVIFASFMITDPRVVPHGRLEQILQGAMVALLFYILEIVGVRYSLFLASFATALMGGLFAYVFVFFPELRESLARREIRNAPSFIVVALIAVGCFSYQLVQPMRQDVPRARISPDFLARGIESPGLLSCPAHSTFASLSNSGLDSNPHSYTTGAAFTDYDGDGFDDLFVSDIHQHGHLYRNTGTGTFTDVSEAAHIASSTTVSAVWGDFDNDGHPDLLVVRMPQGSAAVYKRQEDGTPISVVLDRSHFSPLTLYHNNGDGTFEDISARSGLRDFVAPRFQGAGVTLTDIDNDGHLDIVLATAGNNFNPDSGSDIALDKTALDPFFPRVYSLACGEGATSTIAEHVFRRMPSVLSESVQIALGTSSSCVVGFGEIPLTTAVRSLPGSTSLFNVHFIEPGTAHLLMYRSGRYVEQPEFAALVSASLQKKGEYNGNDDFGHPFDAIAGTMYQPIAFDYDADGKPDIYISTEWGTGLLLHNDGDGVFSRATADAGINYFGTGMGVAVDDYDRDGRPDLFVDNVRADYLFHNAGGGKFTLYQSSEIARYNSGWGTSFIDYNVDGSDDLLIAGGDEQRFGNESDARLLRSFFRSAKLYENVNGVFMDRTWQDLCPLTQSARALAISDIDNDGDEDFFIGNEYVQNVHADAQNMLYRNTTNEKNAVRKHFLEVRLQGTRSNRSGIGAIVTVSTGDHTQTKYEIAGTSYYSQNSPTLFFGLGSYGGTVSVTVRWPSGATTRSSDMVDRIVTIIEPR